MKNSKGYIYILTNPSFKEFVKIGFAEDVEKRVEQLNHSSAVPYAYRIYATYETPTELSDKELHRLIDNLNPELRTREEHNGKKREREFYVMEPEEAYGILECIAKISGTEKRLKKIKPTKAEKAEERVASEHRPKFKFSMIGLKPGDVVVFEDGKTKAVVIDDKRIEVNGEIMSLTKATKVLRNAPDKPFQGTLYWYYNGKKLEKIRREMGL